MPTIEPHWTSYLSAFMTPMVGLIAVGIAFNQWKTAQNKLRLDFFDRRYAVYLAARQLLIGIMRSGDASHQEINEFVVMTQNAKWLFNKAVFEYLDEELKKKAYLLNTLNIEYSHPPSRESTDEEKENYMRSLRDLKELKHWFYSQFEVLDEKVSCSLSLSH